MRNRSITRIPRRQRWGLSMRRFPWRSILAVSPVLVGCGCSVLTSDLQTELERRGEHARGIAYALPMGVLYVQLSVIPAKAEYSLIVKGPEYYADPSARFVLRYQPLPQYEDAVEVTVSPKGYLAKVSATTKDKTGEVILQVVRSVTALPIRESDQDDTAKPVILSEHRLNPTKPGGLSDLTIELNEQLLSHASHELNLCSADDLALDRRLACLEYAALASQARRWKSNPKLERPPVWFDLTRLNRTEPGAKPADCRVGLCYRPAVPYRLTYAMGNGQVSRQIELPNEAPLTEIDISRAFLVEKVQDIVFDANGLLSEVHINKKSEIKAAAEIPLKVVETIGTSVQLRVKLTQEESNLYDQRTKLIAANKNLRDAKAKYESGAVQSGEEAARNFAPVLKARRAIPSSSGDLAVRGAAADQGNSPGVAESKVRPEVER